MVTASQGRGPRADPRADPGGRALREALSVSPVGRGVAANPGGPGPGGVRVDPGTAVKARPSSGTDDRHVSVSFAGPTAALDPLTPGPHGVP